MSILSRIAFASLILLSLNVLALGQNKTTPESKYDLSATLPVDSSIRIGKLQNGLTYYIRKNSKPEKRAELRLVVNAGSILEDDDQLGLAHFVEHMAFNGSKHFEKQQMVNFLESIGMKFGPEVNAYTSFDETVFMLQVPTDSAEILDKSFLILEDWAHNLTFDKSEIDKERGVIIEEWRLGRGAGARMWDKNVPVIFKNSRYALRKTIGEKKILETFDPQTLIRFYKDWYRPDLMAVVAVGDFDVNAIEKLIKDHFSGIPAKKNERERKYYPVPDHKETLFTIATDKEATRTSLEITRLKDKESEKTVNDYRKSLVRGLALEMLNDRYYEISRKPDPPFVNASADFGNYVRTKDAFALDAFIKDKNVTGGMEALLREAERVKLYGFTATELERNKKGMLRGIEKIYNERDKTESNRYAAEYIRNYLTQEPIPGIEFEYNLFNKLIPGITLNEVNDVVSSLLKDENRVVIINAPEKDQPELPGTGTLLSLFSTIQNEKLTPYVDKVSSNALLNVNLSPAKIISEKKINEIGVTELKLSNGIRVVLKPTDFKNDEILFSAYGPGGNSLASDSDYISASVAPTIVTEGGVGQFDKIELQKELTGKVVRVSPWISELNEGLSGSASPDDIKTMFELIYLYVTTPREDSSAFLSLISKYKTLLENRSASPRSAFQDTIQVTMNQYNFRYKPWTEAAISRIDLGKAFNFYKERFRNTGGFTFFFVGNFDVEKIKPLLQTYLGNLPSLNTIETWKDVGRSYPKGVIEKQVYKGIEPQSQVCLNFTGPFKWSSKNIYDMDALTNALQIKLREVLREDKGGTYGVGVYASPSRFPKEEYEITIAFGCDPKKADDLIKTALNQVDSIKTYGIDSIYVEKVREIGIRSREVDLKKNDVWLGELFDSYYNGEDPRNILSYDKLIRGLTPKAIQEAAKEYFNMKNYVKVILYPENISN